MAPAIDFSAYPCFQRRRGNCLHVRLDLPDGALRLDFVNGADLGEPLTIEPVIDLGRALEPQLASVQRLYALARGEHIHLHDQRFVRLLEALRTADALADGASLREIGLGILGSDWPGDGEHLKSRVRRRVDLSRKLLRAGPRCVLAGTI